MSDKEPMPTVTTRVSIQWGDDAPQERTSTLVLTAPSGIFVDLRVLVDWIPDAPHAHEPQPSFAIDWAFAGITTRQSGSSDSNLTESTWTHWVDSCTFDALNVRDSGVSSPMPNGDTCERGEMKDANGILRRYQEVWHDLRVDPVCAAVFVRFRDGSEAAARGIGVHLKDIIPEDVCGVLIRVGGWCQGVLRDTNGFTAERWKLSGDSADSNTKTWVPVFRSGQGNIPCMEVCSAPQALLSGSFELLAHQGLWKCVETRDRDSAPICKDKKWGY
ncbi:hypothetical protein ACEPAH_8680 [Sanghuangporus vaninii]